MSTAIGGVWKGRRDTMVPRIEAEAEMKVKEDEGEGDEG